METPPEYTPPKSNPVNVDQPVVMSDQERQWSLIAHLSPLLGLTSIPLASMLGPLIVWQLKKNELAIAANEAKEALNFQISIAIYFLCSLLLCFLVIGFVLVPAVVIFAIVMTIIAAVKANEGKTYVYPLCLRFIK